MWYSTSAVDREIFYFFVGACILLPRMPFDDKYSVGGDLSRGFRILLLAILVLNLTRFLFQYILRETHLYFVMLGAESTIISFQSLLTPYLLRGWMADRINFPGSRQASRGLNGWIYGVAIVNVTGVAGKVFLQSENLWVFKKIGDMLTFFPVMQTLTLYNTISSAAARYPGRGIVLSQLVMIGEYYSVLSHGADVITKLASLVGLGFDEDLRNSIYHNNGYAAFSRILCHGILLNVVDESSSVQQLDRESGGTSDVSGNRSDHQPDNDGVTRRTGGAGHTELALTEIDPFVELAGIARVNISTR